MPSVTHSKHAARIEIFELLSEYTEMLDADERRGLALAIAEELMSRLSLADLVDWRSRLQSKRSKWRTRRPTETADAAGDPDLLD